MLFFKFFFSRMVVSVFFFFFSFSFPHSHPLSFTLVEVARRNHKAYLTDCEVNRFMSIHFFLNVFIHLIVDATDVIGLNDSIN